MPNNDLYVCNRRKAVYKHALLRKHVLMIRNEDEKASMSSDQTSGLMRHTQRLSDESLSRIRAAAEAVFVREGYIAVTMGQLAEEAGVTRQTLYRHFPSKYDVALDFMQNTHARTLEVWSTLSHCDLADKAAVRRWIQEIISYQVGREYVRAYVELSSTEPRYRQALAALIDEIILSFAEIHSLFADAVANPSGLGAAKAHLFIATLIERSDFIALGEEWFARKHLESIMTDWLLAMTAEHAES
jgi:AcrR family transcriptional regulator